MRIRRYPKFLRSWPTHGLSCEVHKSLYIYSKKKIFLKKRPHGISTDQRFLSSAVPLPELMMNEPRASQMSVPPDPVLQLAAI